MKVLLIGGTGLISTAISRDLLARGDEVVLYNRGKTEARLPAGATTIVGDRKDFPAFEAEMANHTFDAVIDMIGYHPDEIQSCLRAFRGRIGHYIFCSTVDVHTKPCATYPVTEHTPRDPIGDYGVNKKIIEDILFNQSDLPFTIIRPAHTYGESSTMIHTFGWIPYMLKRLRHGLPVVVHGDGTSLWASCHVDDVARAFVNALGNPVALGKAYQTTGEQCVTWDQYHQHIARAMGAPDPTIVHIPTDVLTKWEPDRTGVVKNNFQYCNIFDNSLARAELGFVQKIELEEGARRTVAWLDERNKIDSAADEPFYDQLLERWDRAINGTL
ncbi:MAG: NAD-dependent epimerase/dehydratase family protein [Fimbriimonas sp.]